MTADRMRRVDEAMREVLSGAITSELKDPTAWSAFQLYSAN